MDEATINRLGAQIAASAKPATTPRELPELPVAFDRLPCEPDDDMIDVFTPTQMHAYSRQAIAESEARAEVDARRLEKIMRDMRSVDLHQLTGTLTPTIAQFRAAIDAAIAQEAERDAASA